MNKRFLLWAAAVLVGLGGFTSSARAQETGGAGFGVGVDIPLAESPTDYNGVAPPGAIGVVYDWGRFRLHGDFAYASLDSGNTLLIGGRFLFPLHVGQNADFSIGPGIFVRHYDPDGNFDSVTDFLLEGAAQIRLFLGANVAFHSTLGLGINVRDNASDSFGLLGQLTGLIGITYYFR